jgi:hypothetical protein
MVLKEGFRTQDIRQQGAVVVGTKEMGDRVAEKVREFPAACCGEL